MMQYPMNIVILVFDVLRTVRLLNNMTVKTKWYMLIETVFCTILQIPRLYNVYKEMGIVTSFQNLLDNIFLPLFEVTIDPASHPQLHVFLKQVK
jgi:adenosine deaminase